MNNYIINRKKHLCKYAEDNKLPVGGTFNGKESGWKGQILTYEKKFRKKAIEKYNLIGNIKLDAEFSNKLHPCAHHLSSSQILCYNYFKTMMKGKHPTSELIKFFSERGVKITQQAVCEFEYGGYKLFPKEGTVYDFHIQDEKTELFIEVKYCESAFGKLYGKSKNEDTYRIKFDEVYKKMIDNCSCIRNKDVISEKDFFNNYQLFRNILRVTDDSKYTVFIFPRGHRKLCHEYTQFKNKYIEKHYVNNIIVIHWEDLMEGKESVDLYNKYFKKDPDEEE